MWDCRFRRSAVIASEAKQSISPRDERMDCFASLAMTWRDTAMLTLYFAPGSSSFAVHVALHEIGVPFEPKPMSFKQNDMRSADFLALNPEGKVPTLLIGGRALTEVAAILFY